MDADAAFWLRRCRAAELLSAPHSPFAAPLAGAVRSADAAAARKDGARRARMRLAARTARAAAMIVIEERAALAGRHAARAEHPVRGRYHGAERDA